jgi:hypothetical protein
MNSVKADQEGIAGRYVTPRSANRRILDNSIVFNVVGTIGVILLISVLALWALARSFRGAISRLIHHLSERA